MLVLTRKVDESIIIGEDISIKILSLSGSQVKIGISAPRSLRILRKEVYDEIQAGQRVERGRPVDEPGPAKEDAPPEPGEAPGEATP